MRIMQKRYRVTYVGDDSRNHHEVVWAKSHDEAIKKLKAKDVDMVVGVRKLANPFIVMGIVLFVLALVVIELINR